MPADKKKIAADCWKRGNDALSRENWDYAIDMYTQAAMLVPDNLTYRQTLRGAEYKKFGNNQSGARMASVKLMGVRGKIKKARAQEDWEGVDREAEKGLAVNPWDAQLNADVAEACRERGFDDVAVFGYTKALETEPDNKEYNRALALLLEERGNYNEAIKCWEKIRKLDPLDSEARSKATQLQASSVMDRGGYEGAGSTKDVKSGKTAYDEDRFARQTAPGEVEGPGVSQEADLQRAIRKEPDNKDNYIKLADYYRRNNRLEEASEQLQKALEASGGDANVREQLEDVELELLRHNLDLAKETAQKNSEDESAKKNASRLAKEFVNREVEVLSNRVERYPKDLKLKYELAKRHMRLNKPQQAIPLLQRASNDARIKADVLVSLGKCFMADKQPQLARRQIEKAIPDIDEHDRPELFTEAHYLLGRLCEEAGQTEEAEIHYTDILAVDYEYKDVRQRLEKLQSGQSGIGAESES